MPGASHGTGAGVHGRPRGGTETRRRHHREHRRRQSIQCRRYPETRAANPDWRGRLRHRRTAHCRNRTYLGPEQDVAESRKLDSPQAERSRHRRCAQRLSGDLAGRRLSPQRLQRIYLYARNAHPGGKLEHTHDQRSDSGNRRDTPVAPRQIDLGIRRQVGRHDPEILHPIPGVSVPAASSRASCSSAASCSVCASSY